jgi:hypothetical protein
LADTSLTNSALPPLDRSPGRYDVRRATFLSLINTTGTPSIVNQFFYADNDIGKPAPGVDANNGSVRILGKKETLGGADEIWFDSASNAWYVSTPGQLGVVSAAPGNSIQDVPPPAGKTCCGHSVAAFASSTGHTFIFDPNSGGTGISVFSTP